MSPLYNRRAKEERKQRSHVHHPNGGRSSSHQTLRISWEPCTRQSQCVLGQKGEGKVGGRKDPTRGSSEEDWNGRRHYHSAGHVYGSKGGSEGAYAEAICFQKVPWRVFISLQVYCCLSELGWCWCHAVRSLRLRARWGQPKAERPHCIRVVSRQRSLHETPADEDIHLSWNPYLLLGLCP